METIEQLQAKLKQKEADIQDLRSKGNYAEATKLEEESAKIQYDIEQKQIQAQVDEKVESDAITFAVDGVDLTDLPVEVIKLAEAIVRADRRRIYSEQAIQVNEYETKQKDLEAQLADAKSQLEATQQERNTYQQQLADEKKLRTDAESKRDAAVQQLVEAQKENESLKEQLEEYKASEAFANTQAQPKVYTTADEATEINQALDSVKKFYKSLEDWGSVMKVTKPDGSFELVPRQTVNEEWTAADVPETADTTFRQETDTPNNTSVEADSSQVADDQVKVPAVGGSFQETTDTGVSGSSDEAVRDVHGEGSTGGAESLEARVKDLEDGFKRLSDVVAELINEKDVAA
ncbi:hypothetical protein [Cohnella zeiphila]|uniref:Uncharacterized protein n=1 Tax=Cohnella zeiphila TaxID=2761120 RepID=A0A7X0VVE6_9BACL|nr:hypothetical protein [Cohnella zeiphila]MBB6731901.1 hypothetical protein [Cohnella zeiphila]